MPPHVPKAEAVLSNLSESRQHVALAGIVSAIVTPLSADGSAVAESELRALVDAGIDGGLSGFVPCGGTGEFSSLTPDERRQLLEIVSSQSDGRASVMAQIGACSTRQAIELVRHADGLGVDALMVATPYYEVPDFDSIKRFFHSIADVSTTPLCIYNHPSTMGVAYTEENIAELIEEIPSIKYIKDSSSDALLFSRLVSGDVQLDVFCGDDMLFGQTFLNHRCAGVIAGTANFLAPALLRMFQATSRQDYAEVAVIWNSIEPLISEVFRGHYNSNVKTVCRELGFAVGTVRAPYGGSVAQDERVKKALAATDRDLLNWRK